MSKMTASAFTGASLFLDRDVRTRFRLAWRLMRDDRVTSMKYVLPALIALYLVSPVDLIPDFLLGIGQVDDVGIAIAAAMFLVRVIPRLAPDAIVHEHVRDLGGSAVFDNAEAAVHHQAPVVEARYTVREQRHRENQDL